MDFTLIILNVNENISVDFKFSKSDKEYTFPVFRYQYSVHDREKKFREGLKVCLDAVTNAGGKKYNVKDFQISIQRELKLSIKTPIDFSMEPPLTKLLGFDDKKLIASNEEKSAEDYLKLRPFNIIEVFVE